MNRRKFSQLLTVGLCIPSVSFREISDKPLLDDGYKESSIPDDSFMINFPFQINRKSAVAYMKNDIGVDVELHTISFRSTSDSIFGIIKNPKGGHIIRKKRHVNIVNRDFYGPPVNGVTAYRGGNGYSMAGGDALVYLANQGNEMIHMETAVIIPKGCSIGVNVDPDGDCNGYVAILAKRKGK